MQYIDFEIMDLSFSARGTFHCQEINSKEITVIAVLNQEEGERFHIVKTWDGTRWSQDINIIQQKSAEEEQRVF